MRTPVAAALLALASCATTTGSGSRPLAADEGRLLVYLEPLPASAERLEVELESVEALAADGGAVALDLRTTAVRHEPAPRQRLLAVGRLPQGSYTGLRLKIRRATVAGEPGRVTLAVPAEPERIPVSFAVGAQRGALLSLTLSQPAGLSKALAPSFAAVAPGPAVSIVLGYCPSGAWDELLVFDRSRRRVISAIPVGREPQAVAIDPRLPRAYVSLAGEDRIAVVDVDAGEVTGRLLLRAGDQPGELAVAPDGRTLLVVNGGSSSVAFLDPASGAELARVDTGDDPGSLLLEPGGRRAYVLNRGGSSITVLDLANRAVAATLGTESRPVRARFNRAGNRLYVIHAGSPWLSVFSVPELQLQKKIQVGMGQTALAVGSRGDLVYVGGSDARLQIFDSLSLFPVSALPLLSPPDTILVDESQNVLFALQRSRGAVEAIDMVSGRSLGSFDVGDDTRNLSLVSERR